MNAEMDISKNQWRSTRGTGDRSLLFPCIYIVHEGQTSSWTITWLLNWEQNLEIFLITYLHLKNVGKLLNSIKRSELVCTMYLYSDSTNIYQIYCSKIGRHLTKNTVWVAQFLAGNVCTIFIKIEKEKRSTTKKHFNTSLYWIQNIYFANFFKMNSFFINAKMKKCKIALMQQMHWCCSIGPESI